MKRQCRIADVSARSSLSWSNHDTSDCCGGCRAALFLWMDVGVGAAASSMVRIAATTRERPSHVGRLRHDRSCESGDLRAVSVEQDPSLPARLVERMQQYYQGVPIFGAQIVRDSDSGVAQSIFGEVPQALHARHAPGARRGGGRAGDHRHRWRSARLLRRDRIDDPADGRRRAAPRLHAVVSTPGSVFRLFVDANTGARAAAVLRAADAVGRRHRPRPRG